MIHMTEAILLLAGVLNINMCYTFNIEKENIIINKRYEK